MVAIIWQDRTEEKMVGLTLGLGGHLLPVLLVFENDE
jgi:hypothetical protein